MSTLREISEQFRELQRLADDPDMAVAVADTLEGIEAEFEHKARAIVTVAQNMDDDVRILDDEIKRLQARKKSISNRQAQLKDWLRQNMEVTGITRIACPLFTINCVQGREVAVVENADALPDEYVSIKTTVSPDLNGIAKALKDGADIPGARLERAKSSIRIK